MKSWKIGAIAGLIAGLAMGLVIVLITLPIAFKFGLYYWGLPHPPEIPFTKIATNEIISNLILGVIFGSIYSKVYPVIPGKGIWKGLPFGLFGYLAHNVYFAIIFLPYLYLDLATRVIFVGLIDWIVFGLFLGISYEFLHNRYYIAKKEPRIIEYDMKGGHYTWCNCWTYWWNWFIYCYLPHRLFWTLARNNA